MPHAKCKYYEEAEMQFSRTKTYFKISNAVEDKVLIASAYEVMHDAFT